ncbi:MAG: hypothetical protein A3A94_01640 [Candidatus Portnoybacteria bacterium RIFCSPLOWO2_01_FULL_43_11]|uniref:Type II secretion system protein GspI C-terminal domain-containing protein n=4 Tax=Candidatus Portnoyibacteriota TaxID=1817913 RepID=A0A1G2FCP6_9BACT|nr:MAG: hypothetical protein A2815_00385 [Candidatus Portnoybacteria bacterium RIFCSPHIGHO2_01_FULL_40_12b]OGZ37800.1 MAG: hypothetical protein A3E90_02160 [Candidatus Portnoybacteria bacterium RIFCSPHIGHO2_12_FULL_40_11]OGZ39168.1 MAG: hypothetical protein A3A94_01640 [Candidatus Portnoybacteria bacterium RIFCSPLOWO2_01_FULL_43_11]OGZ39898.1 MAG: hypothetical protein A3I20_02795 [Candidatus Portnoybacteria bacterium RIFCSPLOWO2_02_FULL_40_15]
MFSKLKNYQKGFTLMEALIAIAILVIAITGATTLASQSLRTASYFKQQTVAFYLASEALEYIRNSRDTHLLAGNEWDNWKTSAMSLCYNGNDCGVDAIFEYTDGNAFIDDCSNSNLLYDSNNLYNYQSGSATAFERCVYIRPIDSYEVEVEVKVEWSGLFGNKVVRIKEHFFDWQ